MDRPNPRIVARKKWDVAYTILCVVNPAYESSQLDTCMYASGSIKIGLFIKQEPKTPYFLFCPHLFVYVDYACRILR